jgi:hypothetical protein
VDWGLRPNASETSLPAPLYFPFGEVHVNSAIFVVLTLCISKLSNVWSRWRGARRLQNVNSASSPYDALNQSTEQERYYRRHVAANH